MFQCNEESRIILTFVSDMIDFQEMQRRITKLSSRGDEEGGEKHGQQTIADLENRLKTLLKTEKELQTALKHVGNEMDAEAEVEKLRILGFAVDSRMLEGVLGLLSATVLTLWQVFRG